MNIIITVNDNSRLSNIRLHFGTQGHVPRVLGIMCIYIIPLQLELISVKLI